ncbi:MAG: rhamnogalacturonan acetylesterase [Flavobacterium sp.]|nr:rhamnogalacturonan acetylesterase [Flavobacterium sp.]
MKHLKLFIVFAAIGLSFTFVQNKPTLYLIGDSTVRNTGRPMCGWGEMIGLYIDSTKINISNQAMAGRSTRTFIKEGRWAKLLSTIKQGDYLIMQFGHNEGSKPDTTKAGYRGVLNGTGQETVDLVWPDGKPETVHTYGFYLRQFVQEAKAKGAIPIICSMIPRNDWKDGKVLRADASHGKWAAQIAKEEGVYFINLNNITALKYEAMGQEKVKAFFPNDHTHTNVEGATINAASVVDGLKLLTDCKLNNYLKANN